MKMKKQYIKPTSGIVKLNLSRGILDVGLRSASDPTISYGAREIKNDVWDDEEEEENTGGWFQ
jgi:hypothetical protein